MIDWKCLRKALLEELGVVLLVIVGCIPFILAWTISLWFVLFYPILYFAACVYDKYDDLKFKERQEELWNQESE